MRTKYSNADFDSSDGLERVDFLLAQTAETSGGLGQAAAYLFEHPGKCIRVRLSLDLARSCRLPREHAIVLATAVELLHSASLVLDDVQDNDRMRRGRPTVWRKFGRPQAINLGTYLIAQSFAFAARLPGISQMFAIALRDATIGQSAEVDFKGDAPTLAAYIAMAEKKTGALFSLPAQAVALLARLPEGPTSEIGVVFAQLGAAYQIQDDLADALGLKGRARAGLDLREGKANSIMVLHLALKPEDKAPFMAFQRDRSARADDARIDDWLNRLFSSGSIVIAKEHLQQLCFELINTSSALPAPFSTHLAKLASGFAEPAVLKRVNCAAVSHSAV